MGICVSAELQEQRIRTMKLNEILEEGRKESKAIKLLLLGPAGSGKTTILKQMMIRHTGGFSKVERAQRKFIIRNNVLTCMSSLLNAMNQLEISFGPKLQPVLGRVDFGKMLDHRNATTQEQDDIFPSLYEALNRLWKDRGVQKCYRRRNEFSLEDSAKYFLDNLVRICSASFEPTDEDILRSHTNTTGVQEIKFEFRSTLFKVFDAGGSWQSARRKWIHQFDIVHSVIFVAALSDYITRLPTRNAMEETLNIFDGLLSLEWFSKKAIVLFLNKKDLFEESLRLFPLKKHFPKYGGIKQASQSEQFSDIVDGRLNQHSPLHAYCSFVIGEDNYKKGIKFMKELFKKRNIETSRMIYMHTTCAIDTHQVENAIDSVLNLILDLNIEKSRLE